MGFRGIKNGKAFKPPGESSPQNTKGDENMKGVRPIMECFLEPNYLFALEFREGFVFGRVVRRRICKYAPYPLIDSAGNAVDIAADGYQSELRFRDPRNTENDILYLDTSTNSGFPWILHGGIGIRPSQINMYPRFPEGQSVPGKFPSIDPIRPTDGDNVGYVSSAESPYDEPTNYVEYVIPPGQHLGAEFYNADGERAHQPVLNLTFSVYWFQVLRTDTHQKLIRQIATRAVPAKFLTVGFGDRPIDLGGTLRRDWNVAPVSLEEAAAGGE